MERTLSWLNRKPRLKIRYERRADVHLAFLVLGCVLICWNFIQQGFCQALLVYAARLYVNDIDLWSESGKSGFSLRSDARAPILL